MTISEPEKISIEALRNLSSADSPCVTIVLPELEARNAPIALKGALAKVRLELEGRVPKHDVAPLLDPIESAGTGLDSSEGPATFIFLSSPGRFGSFHTRYFLGPRTAAVGESFQLLPLLALAGKQLEFYILALQLNHTRILKCTDRSFETVRFPKGAGTEAAGFIPGASQAVLRAEPVHDRDHPNHHLGSFYREVDRDVNALLKGGYPPLVVVSVEHELALFHRLSTYPECVEPGIPGLPDRLSDHEMHRRAVQLVRSVTTGPTHHALAKFDKHIGTGHASSEVGTIADAAFEGRVEHLFVREEETSGWHEASSVDSELLNTIALQTLRHGGGVSVLTEANMPGGVPVCAVFRYALKNG